MTAVGVSRLRLVIAPLTIAVGVATVLLVPHPDTVPTTYSGGSGLARAADVVAGLSLLAAGLATMIARSRGPLGVVVMLAGAAWFAPDWIGWEGGPSVVRSTGMVVAPFVAPLFFHIALAAPSGRLGSNAARAVVIAVYGVAALASLGLALLRDPFLDQYCWSNCTENVFLVRPEQDLARLLQEALLLVVLTGAAAVVALAAWRSVRARGAARRVVWPLAIAGGVLGAALAAYAGALLRDPTESAEDTLFATLFLVRAGAATLLAVAVGWSAYLVSRTRSAVAHLAVELGEAPAAGSLRAALAASLRDPDVEVAYPIGASERFVDGAGNVVPAPTAGPDRVVTSIARDGMEVAVVVHARGAVAEEDLAREIGSAARLAVDNERLQAELLARLHDLQASRTRIVETGDGVRRLLERDLHDGAQQRLLALSYDLRVARAAAEAEGDLETASRLAKATDDAQAALVDLRELAHGIHPAILTEAGLGPALATLADGAPLAVEIDATAEGRYPAAIETAAYLVVAEAIDDAARRGARYAAVSAQRHDERLVVKVEDDGSERSSPMTHLADRVGAVGGHLDIERTTLQAEIPCA